MIRSFLIHCVVLIAAVMADDAEQHKKVKRVIGEIEAAETVEIEAAVIQKGAPSSLLKNRLDSRRSEK